jgi:hypothetical protein
MVTRTGQAPGRQDADDAVDRLRGLAGLLTDRGLRSSLTALPGSSPMLHVVNPASALAEDIYARRAQDGNYWFWWSWAERMAAGNDAQGAAALIERVLAVHGGGQPAAAG